MRPKWVRYMAMGIALLLAVVMLVSAGAAVHRTVRRP